MSQKYWTIFLIKTNVMKSILEKIPLAETTASIASKFLPPHYQKKVLFSVQKQ